MPGVDEIRPEYLKSLDVVGLSWLTRLCSTAWRSGTVPLECAKPGMVVPLFKKRDRRVCSNYRGTNVVLNHVCGGSSTSMGSGALAAKGCSVSVRLEQELGSHCTRTFSMYWRRFAAECEAAGMRISTSKSEAMVLDQKRVVCPLRVGGKVLPQVEQFKYLGVLFTSEGKMECEIDRSGLVQPPQLCPGTPP
ncbi:hypothetical protein L3Q82_006364 [Scortum barcoo]|uniref:Uncharacterized protein n=1 Tax=Scortum barcoo TaxID=214431 RepID=A0ACB8X096_9TELE|nr:hypothetical protein L3Q82_006364 [Scortum barcoo]